MKLGRRRLKSLRKRKTAINCAYRKQQLKDVSKITPESIMGITSELKKEADKAIDKQLDEIAEANKINPTELKSVFHDSGMDLMRFLELSKILPWQSLRYWADMDPMQIKPMEIKPYEYEMPHYFGWDFAQ